MAVLAVSTLILTACVPQQVTVVEGSSLGVAWPEAFTSYNPDTSSGDTAINAAIAYVTNSSFAYYNDELALVRDESFGTYEVVAEDPLTVEYTVNDSTQWSDGTPVDAADLLLEWVAHSGVLNTVGADPSRGEPNPDTGEHTDRLPTDVVYFDGRLGSGLELVSQVPEIDGTTITLVYDEFFVDWELIFGVGVPAHVTAGRALGIEDPIEAKQALIDAVQSRDTAALSAISSFWNSGFDLGAQPGGTDTDLDTDFDTGLMIGSGPYVLSDVVADEYLTLTVNDNYRGDHQPRIEEITLRFIPDALAAVDALSQGTVDIISPEVTAEVADRLSALGGVRVRWGASAVYEHIDLSFQNSQNGTFDDPLVREAFLLTIPRVELVETLIAPHSSPATVRDSQLFFPGSPGYDEAVQTNGMRQAFSEKDIAGARALIAESGAGDPEVCILYASNDPRRVEEFALIRAAASEAGFVVEDCGSPDWAGLLGVPGAYDAALFGWEVRSAGVTNVAATFATGGINNYNSYSNSRVDALLDELALALDESRRLDILLRIDDLLVDDHYGLTIGHDARVVAHNRRVAGVGPGPVTTSIFWNVWDWTPTDPQS